MGEGGPTPVTFPLTQTEHQKISSAFGMSGEIPLHSHTASICGVEFCKDVKKMVFCVPLNGTCSVRWPCGLWLLYISSHRATWDTWWGEMTLHGREDEWRGTAHSELDYHLSPFQLFLFGLETISLHSSLNCTDAFASEFIQNSAYWLNKCTLTAKIRIWWSPWNNGDLPFHFPRHKRVDSHISLSRVFASIYTNLLSLPCSLNLLKWMVKESSTFWDLSTSLSHKTDIISTVSFHRQFCSSLISNQGRSHALRDLHICKCKWWLGSKSLHKVFFANCSASHFLASSQTRKFWEYSQSIMMLPELVCQGLDIGALPTLASTTHFSEGSSIPWFLCPYHKCGSPAGLKFAPILLWDFYQVTSPLSLPLFADDSLCTRHVARGWDCSSEF